VEVGDLVKYKVYPHECLQHLLGLVTELETITNPDGLRGVYVIWNQDRNRGPANAEMFEFMHELEIIK
jgi:hypothetical protein